MKYRSILMDKPVKAAIAFILIFPHRIYPVKHDKSRTAWRFAMLSCKIQLLSYGAH